jgi:AraC-like DNA-binding protein
LFARAYLYRVFAEHGETVAHYVRELRLQRARELLSADADGDARIGDLAYRCGFEDPVHFPAVPAALWLDPERIQSRAQTASLRTRESIHRRHLLVVPGLRVVSREFSEEFGGAW